MLKDLQGILGLIRPYAVGALKKGATMGRFAMGGPAGMAFSLFPSYLRSLPSDTPESMALRHARGQTMRNAIMGAVDAEPGQNKFDNAFSAFDPSQFKSMADPMADYIKKQNAAAGVPSPQPMLPLNSQASAPVPTPPVASTPLPQARPLTAGDNTYNYGGVQVPVFGKPDASPYFGAGFGAGDGFMSPSNMGQGSNNNLDLMKLILGKF